MLWWKFAKFLMLFSKPQVSFSSNFLSLFSVKKDNSSILFLAQALYTLVKKNPLKYKFLRFLSGRVKICQIPHVNFETTSQFLFKAHLYFFSCNFIYFQQKEPIEVQIWWNFTWAVESLKFCTLMGSFCPNHIKFQLKKYRRVISHDTEEWCKD